MVYSALKEREALPLDVLDWSVRTSNCLRNANISLLGELRALSERDILKMKNAGRKTLAEIQGTLEYHGFPRLSPDTTSASRMIPKTHHMPLDYEFTNLTTAINYALSTLKLKDAMVVYYRCVERKSLGEIADFMGVTKERIRQRESKGLRMLRHPARAKHLRKFKGQDSRLIKAVFGID